MSPQENHDPIKPQITVPPPETRTAGMQLIWRCTHCGHIFPQHAEIPENCPSCGKHKEFYEQVNED